MTTLGFPIAAVYSFALFSLAAEFGWVVLGINPYLTMITGPLGIIAALASGNLLLPLRPGPGRWLAFFTVWMLAAGAFGIYRGGSFMTMQEFTLKQLPVLFIVAALMVTKRQLDWYCRIMAFGGLLVLAMAFKLGTYDDNRFMIPHTSLQNPNDFATHLLAAMPFCVLLILNSGTFSPLKIIGLVGVVGLTMDTLRTGSRGAFLSIVAILAMLFVQLPGAKRLVLLVICIVGSIIGATMFPQVLLSRFKTILSSEVSSQSSISPQSSEATTVDLAESSTRSRLYMLKRSLIFTAKNPIFGVGPGNFAVAEAGHAEQQGIRAAWLGTHNSYTQTSSEGGIPAFVFFTAALVTSIKINSGIYRRTRQRPELRSIANTALCLLMAVFGFAVNILFSHLAYRFYVPMLVGVTVAFSAIAEREILAAGAVPIRNR